MEKRFCLNITSDNDKYSSPMPIIGLYIAGGTVVCFLFMIYDLFHGLCRRKPWIPCRLFSLNSVTLTLLAIASKLPLDLTTSMPSAQDQLSKLSATVLICISMSFFSFSLATQHDSERLSNMISLTIFVVTVVVNVCIQIVTGVIFSFIIEHIIIMSGLIVLLILMWNGMFFLQFGTSSLTIDRLNKKFNPLNSESSNMIHRLKSFYVSSYLQKSESEFLAPAFFPSVSMISILCVLVLLQAAFQSLILKKVEFRCGVSDYKWSIWMVVVTQILTVLGGAMAILFRGFFSVKVLFNEKIKETDVCFGPPPWVLATLSKLHIMPFLKNSQMGFMIIFQTFARNVKMVWPIVTEVIGILAAIVNGINALLTVLSSIMFYMISILVMKIAKVPFCKQRNGKQTVSMDREQWIQRNCMENIKRWMEKRKRDPPTHLIQLLSRTPPSQESFTHEISTISNETSVSCLLVVLLVRVSTIALPDIVGASLIHTLDEVFEIIYFIDETINVNKGSCGMAKELWMKKDFSLSFNLFFGRINKSSVKKFDSDVSQPQLDLCRAIGIIEKFKRAKDRIIARSAFGVYKLPYDQTEIIYEFIIGKGSQREYASIDELHARIEQLFVDMLHFLLSQLPLAIFKYLDESPAQQFEERLIFSIKCLGKIEQLENIVHWQFPDGTGITSLITPQVTPADTQVHHSSLAGTCSNTDLVSAINTQCIEPLESNEDANAACRVIEDDEIQEIV